MFARDRDAAYEVVQSYMDTDPVTKTPFFESGLIVTNPIISELAQSATGIVDLPFWLPIDASVEPNYSNDVYEDIAVPRKIGTGSMKARNCHLNEGFGSMDFVTDLTGKDPLARVASRLDLYWRQEAELRIVATLRGILNDAIAASTGMVHQATNAEGITFNGLIDAQMTMGDAFGGIGGYVMNSAAFGVLVKEKLAQANFDAERNLLVRTLNGLPVIVNDTAMTLNGSPVVALIGQGAFAYGMGNPKVPLAYEREEARGNGGGAETLWTRRNMIVHPIGFSFTSTSITGNGTETVARGAGWTDLANAANWQLVANRKQVPIAFLTVAA
ncbi:major capsid protein [Paracoccus aminovorans]|uniref:major capsid protein n=1 Tax=Paracoccus aminovorans TaxID=34004 RepID=UPI001C12B300|nr:major capsid protein [Paracoccus aminovorans]MDQ7776293.1 major capsid protein [Paracoccus aminovorans]